MNFRLLATLLTLHTTFALHMDCMFITLRFNNEDIYSCDVDGKFEIRKPNLTVKSTSKVTAEVLGLDIESKEVHFFPRGLEKFFKNLISLRVKKSGLREIHQSDLAVFTKLKYINLEHNALTTIESELFRFNQHLETIWLSHNTIEEIQENVFDDLKELKDLDLRGVACIGRSPNRHDIQAVIETVKKSCSNCPKGLEEIQGKLTTLEGKFEALKTAKIEADKFKGENGRLKSEIQRLKDEAETSKKQAQKNIEIHNANREKNLNILKAELAKLKADADNFAKFKTENLHLKAEVSKYKNEQAVLVTEIVTLKSDLKAKNFEIDAKNKEICQLKSEITLKESQIKAKELMMNLTRPLTPNITDKLKECRDEVSKLSTQMQNSLSESQNLHLKAEVSKYRNEQAVFVTEIETLKASAGEILTLKLDLNGKKLEIDAKNKEICQLKSEITLKESQIKAKELMMNLTRPLTQNSTDKFKECRDEVSKLSTQMQSSLSESEITKSQLESSQEINQKLVAMFNELKSKSEACDEKLTNSEGKVEKNLKDFNEKLLECEAKLENSEQKLVEAQENHKDCLETSKNHEEKLHLQSLELEDQLMFQDEENKEEFNEIDELKMQLDEKEAISERKNTELIESDAKLKNCEGKFQINLQSIEAREQISSSAEHVEPKLIKLSNFSIFIVIIVVLVTSNILLLVCCCIKSKRYTKSTKISSVSDYMEDFDSGRIPLNIKNENIYQSIRELKKLDAGGY